MTWLTAAARETRLTPEQMNRCGGSLTVYRGTRCVRGLIRSRRYKRTARAKELRELPRTQADSDPNTPRTNGLLVRRERVEKGMNWYQTEEEKSDPQKEGILHR